MLKLLRRKKITKWIFYFLAAVIIPAFIIWGSSTVIDKSKTPEDAGILFGKKVSFRDYSFALHAWKTQLKLQYGDQSEEIASGLFDAGQAAWDRLILLREAKKRKIKIKNAEVIAAVTNLPFLQEKGRFSAQAYKLFLQYSLGESPVTFEENLRQNLTIAKVYEEVTRNIALTDEEIKKEYEKQNAQTRVKYVFFSPQESRKELTVSEDEIKADQEKTKTGQTTEEVKDRLLNERSRQAAKQKAADFLARIKNNNLSFEQAAQEAGLSIKETPLFSRESSIPELGRADALKEKAFSLASEAMADSPVELESGFYCLRSIETLPFDEEKFKKEKDEFSKQILEQKRGMAFNAFFADLKKQAGIVSHLHSNRFPNEK